ncbi:MAG: hypothetical protein OEU09_09580, partial [Rhodospirillales bacterium]|nr:hypothetical protein [Rhodospirillales bacterium]
SGIRSMLVDAPLSDLRGEYRTEPVPPEPNRFVADIDASLEQQVFVAGLFFRGAIASVPPRAGRG